jgi:predicted ATPase/signal transduction histidine kinase
VSANLKIQGYILNEIIHEDMHTILYRATRERNQHPVILKTSTADYPTLERITRLRHEYKITENLNLNGVVQVYELEVCENRLILVSEDFGGQSLKLWLSTYKPSIIEFLELAIQLAKALQSIHDHQIIHKDIKPANIIINPCTLEVKLTDFSIASRLDRETPLQTNPEQLEGTLAYMSPEQTGRMNRCIDYRTDFYSLGATLYEILTGVIPFKSNDPLELIHCHVAKLPIPIRQLNTEIPWEIEAIVGKLMEKNAESRYQSAIGLITDLEFCLNDYKNQLQNQEENQKEKQQNNILNFIPGERDSAAQLLIPQKLYGREKEAGILLEAFERVGNLENNLSPNSEMVLVSGYSGIGKSSLVNEIHKPILSKRGYFTTGKFDQYQRNIPYSSLIQALKSLMRQLLTEEACQLQKWKEKLLTALGDNGQLVVNVIPELESIIGTQLPVSELQGFQAQHRFNQVFQAFIQVFAQAEHPLAIFLDDLQWADSASLEFIKILMANQDSKNILLIGAYRDNEVTPGHPFLATLEDIQRSGTRINHILLRPLGSKHVQQIIAETLKLADDDIQTKELASLLFNKTQGNPFFLNQLLKTLYQERLLFFNFTESRWQWNFIEIQATGIADKSVVDLIASNIVKLPKVTQDILKLAACIGAYFKLEVLATINYNPLPEIAHCLQPALESGLILPLHQDYRIPLLFADKELDLLGFDKSQISYRFLHDKVQQAAYSLIPKHQKQILHLKIGKLLLQNQKAEKLNTNIFDIVNQLNIGSNDNSYFKLFIKSDKLAELNLIAGRRAKTSVAYESAAKYLRIARKLLDITYWNIDYQLTLDIYTESAETEYLTTNFEKAFSLSQIVLQKANKLLDKVNIYELLIDLNIGQGQQRKAVEVGLEAIEMLGILVEEVPCKLPQLSDLDDFPEMTEPRLLASIRILSKIAPPSYQSAPDIYPKVVQTMVNLCLKYGHSPLASYAYGAYSAFQQSIIGNAEASYHSGQIALKLLEKYPTKELEVKVYMVVSTYALPGKDHVKTTLNPLIKAINSGLEVGNIAHAGLSIIAYCSQLFLSGENLETVKYRLVEYITLLQKLKQKSYTAYAKIWGQLVINLVDEISNPSTLVGKICDEREILPWFEKTGYYQGLFIIYIAKAIIFYTFGEYKLAIDCCERGSKYQKATLGLILGAVYNFYHSLSLIAIYSNADIHTKFKIITQVNLNQEKLKTLANNAPSNFLHKYDLVAAELAKIQGEILEAIYLYDTTITLAAENGYIQDEALANERAAIFYIELGKTKIAKVYMTEAYYAYIKWGAITKVRDLEKNYPDLIISHFQVTNKQDTENDNLSFMTFINTIARSATSTSSPNNLLDLGTILKSAEIINSEIILEDLLEKLVNIVLENTGAEIACLILEKDDKLFIEASSNKHKFLLTQSIPVEESHSLPMSLINYVVRTQQPLIIGNAAQDSIYSLDSYIIQNQPKSILCSPIIYKSKFLGIFYLENNLVTNAFTRDRLEMLKLLTIQAGISIENARLYAASQEKTQQLQQSLEKLQQTQAQLVHTERISSLGQMLAGIAHEVNNPVTFISGNLCHLQECIEDIINHLDLYQQHCPNIPTIIEKNAKKISLDFILEDLPNMIGSMKVGTDRIKDIMESLRNYSRIDTPDKKTVNIHNGIDATLIILQHRLKANAQRPTIEVIKNYGNLPLISCYSGQLNQVFMNLIANAIDALDESNQGKTFTQIQEHPNIITINTSICSSTNSSTVQNQTIDFAEIRIVDNALGISEEIQAKLFNAFFTTKVEGKGTGLGLSISYQIITETHKGTLHCASTPGKGTEFIIKIPL